MMKYKGYIGNVEYDDEAKIFHGEVVGLRDIITFQGKSVGELEQSFKDSVDDYLTWRKERGEEPASTQEAGREVTGDASVDRKTL